MTKTGELTEAEASAVVDAVIGERLAPVFAAGPMRTGDIALILRSGGGLEICTLLNGEPDRATYNSIGVRGLVALALCSLAHNRQLMIDRVLAVHRSSQRAGGTAPLSN